MQCQAMRWADEYSDMVDAADAAYEEAENVLIANPDLADALAGDMALEDGIDTSEWTKAQWDQYVSDMWETIVESYMEHR